VTVHLGAGAEKIPGGSVPPRRRLRSGPGKDAPRPVGHFSAAREPISALEELMLSELETEGEERAAGWDTDTSRENFR
jgi:hypothetical protein